MKNTKNLVRIFVSQIPGILLFASLWTVAAVDAAPHLTTRQQTIRPVALPMDTTLIAPSNVAAYATYGYSDWEAGPGEDAGRRFDLMPADYSGSPNAASLLSFFSMSDIHITDKESPAQALAYGWLSPFGSGMYSAYSPTILSTTHGLDAAIQAVNALHQEHPIDFGIFLGDAINNAQYNELRWYIDVIDGKWITPSSGAHLGADTIDYQKPYQATGLDPSIPWYQVIGNHDQFWSGVNFVNDKLLNAFVGTNILNIGADITDLNNINETGLYMGVVDGSTPYGLVIGAGLTNDFLTPPTVIADPDRRSLATTNSPSLNWMAEFFDTDTLPVGHGFTQENLDEDFSCYTFEPKADLPIRVIVFDNNAKTNNPSAGFLYYAYEAVDHARYTWLTNELQRGQDDGMLMIIAAHIPILPQKDISNTNRISLMSVYSDYSDEEMIATFHNYPNLILLMGGHMHRNTVTPHPSPDPDHPENGFWGVEVPSVKDFPQQFRTFDIRRNRDHTISIFATSVDTLIEDGTPAAASRGYAVATARIYGGTNTFADTSSHAYNAELIVPLSPAMQTNIAGYGTVSYTNTIAVVSNAIVAAMAEDGTVGVSIALVDGLDIVWAQGFGYADREAGIPVTPDTVFHIGSVSKAFTAATVLQYAERGLVDLDAPFTNYIPSVTWKERFPEARPITTLDLLTHHSGLPGDLLRAGFLTKPLGRGWLETTNDLAQTYPILEPGTFNNYCNVGFVLLEGVAEAAAAAEGDARPFEQLANANLFEILGMDGTSYVLDKPAISNHLAVPYMGGERMPLEHVEIYGTGSLYSRPVDMAQFLIALFADDPLVLLPETRDLMIADHSTNALFDAYFWLKAGLGWDTVSDPRLAYAGPAVWKNGATLLYSAQFLFLPEKKLGVAIVANSPSGVPMAVDALALQHALLERDGLPWPTNALVYPTNTLFVDQAELDALAGVYIGSSNYDLVESRPGSLTYRRDVPDDSLTLENLRQREDGWFLSDDAPEHGITFTNAHGRDIVLHRQNHGTFEMSSVLAERFHPPVLPAAWSNRIGHTWVARNVPADDYPRLMGIAPTLTFLFDDNVLYLETGGFPVGRALDPVSDDLAWLPGLVNRSDSAVQIIAIGGVEHVLHAGYVYGPAPEDIPLADSVSGTIATERFADWYEIQPANPPAPVGGVDDIYYQLALSGAPEHFLLRVFEADGVTPVAERTGNGPLDVVSGAAPLVLSVQPGSDGAQTGTYEIAFSVPLLVRELVRDGDHYAVAWQGPTGAVVTVEAAPFLAEYDTFVPLMEGINSTNLLLHETVPAGPDPERFFRVIESSEAPHRLGQVLLISDIHLSPYVDATIVADLLDTPIEQWDTLFAVATNGLFAYDATGWRSTSPLLLESAVRNAQAVCPQPDAVLVPGDILYYELISSYTNLVAGSTREEGKTVALKTFQYAHAKLRDAFPASPILVALGNNDTFLGDYDIEASGDAFYAATAETLYAGGITNVVDYTSFAATYTNAGSYAVSFGSGRVVALQTAYLSANYPRGTASGWEQLDRLELELQSAEAANEPVWILLHIPPGINPYPTWQQWHAGDTNAAVTDWQEPFLETFCEIVAAHPGTVAGIIGGHYHNRSWQLIADPATTNAVATLQIANGILYNHGNNPGFTVLTYDRETLDIVAENTYSIDVAAHTGSLDPDVSWSIRYSQNQGYRIADLSVSSLEGTWNAMSDFTSAPARHYNAQYSGGRPPFAMNATNWPVYHNAIRYTTPTQFRDRTYSGD